MAVKIKLKRMGKIRAPYYRIIVADARTKRDGRAIEEIGKYHPKVDPSLIEVDSDRAQYWLSVGAQPTDPVRKLLEVTGDWQKFKGLPGAEGTLKTVAPRPDKKDAFAAAVAETVKELKPKAGGKAGDAKAEPKADRGKAADAKAEAKADRGKARKPASADKAATEADKPASAAKDGAAKAESAKDSAGKDSAGKDSAGKDSAGKDSAKAAGAKATTAKDTPANADAAKDDSAEGGAAAKSATAKGDSAAKGSTAKSGAKADADAKTDGAAEATAAKGKGDGADGASEADAAGEEAAVAGATPAGQDSEA